ncbi:MAG: chloride channel protein [Tepidiformaceae bacterium]
MNHWLETVGHRFREPLREGVPGDFTTSLRLLPISGLALIVGIIGAFLAWTLLKLIAFFTNLFFYQRLSDTSAGPADAHLGLWLLVVPVIGGLLVGLMARYGSDKIRGHGIPEAIESILINGSRVQPRVAVLKPLSSAISIGSGGPFGAEGPIIMTGGAVGSLISQMLKLSATERKTLLVAGAAAGMSATFAAPVAAVLLAVELLLFEWKPRSLIPVAIASAAAAATRHWLLPASPLFPVPPHSEFVGLLGLFSAVIVGLSAGVLSAVLTGAVYGAEDAFHRLPIHWMWWPALGGLAIGVGGLIFPEALGVGYSNIAILLTGTAPTRIILGVLLVKSAIWAISLGSGTSGGVLAPLLMIGASVGALEAGFLPGGDASLWPIIGLGAMLGGTMRAPLTGVIFVLELTHDSAILLPLLIAVVIAHGFTVLLLRRSILTEKLSRRGHHLAQEYGVDVLEGTLVRQAMRTDLVAIPAGASLAEIAGVRLMDLYEDQDAYPIVDADREFVGIITAGNLARLSLASDSPESPGHRGVFGDIPASKLDTIGPGATMREAADRMASVGASALAVVDESGRLLGLVSVRELLAVRSRAFELETYQERVITLRIPFTRAAAPTSSP